MSSISRWLCTSNTKHLFIKIVHPGGHIELHDRPMQAAELLSRNPKCCVALPTIFQQPYAIVSPETTLILGQKYYVVPLGTIRKLQLKHPSTRQATHRQNIGKKNDGGDGDADDSSACWLFRSSKKRAKGKNGSVRVSAKIRKGGSDRRWTEELKTDSGMKRASEDFSSSARVGNGGSSPPGRISLVSMDNWQPGLESITED